MHLKNLLLFIAVLLMFKACEQPAPKSSSTEVKEKNEVLVLGMLHSGHLKQEEYNLDVVTDLITKINPDIILTEIPPDRYKAATEGFLRDDTISEPRVMRFPEYTDVVFPLSKKMNFEIIPTAGWTKPMADKRSAQLKAIRDNPDRAADWKAYTEANQKMDSLMEATGHRYDPYFVNSDEYDEISEIGLGVYNDLFNEELGLGGWDNINAAHYGHIEDALEKYTMQGKRILITYGAGHKGWFMRKLRKRKDIKLISLKVAMKG